jgi:riboflavin kinase/FMN adenylyltransferase
MKATEELARLPPRSPSVVTIGVFDGVHLGHRHLLGGLKAEAQRLALRSVTVVFTNSPAMVLRPQDPDVPLLSRPQERVDLLKEQGVDLVVPLTFDLELSHLRATDFLALLHESLDMHCMVMGPRFSMGHGREVRTLPALREMGEAMGFSVTGVEPIEMDGRPVSSTAVRKALALGNVEEAARLLGRQFTLQGRVVMGEARGRLLGFPTANLDIEPFMALPADGIYATWAHFGDEKRASATNIGVRPTFGPGERTVEAHILDFNGDLYGQEVRLEFVARLREERRFETSEALVEQMHQDVAHAKSALASVVSGKQ